MATFLHRASGNAPGVAPSVNAWTVRGMTPDDLRGQTGPAGPVGPAGPAGPEGEPAEEVEFQDHITMLAAGPSHTVCNGGVWATPGCTTGTAAGDEEQAAMCGVLLDESDYDADATFLMEYRFQVQAYPGAEDPEVCVRLYNETEEVPVANSQVCRTSLGPHVVRTGALNLGDGLLDDYVVQSRGTDSGADPDPEGAGAFGSATMIVDLN